MEISANAIEEKPELSKSIPNFDSPVQEIRYLNSLESTDNIMSLGDRLIKACQENDMGRFADLLEHRKLPLLIWHVVRCFNIILESRNFDMLKFFVKSGLDLSHIAFRGTVPKVVIMMDGFEDIAEDTLKTLVQAGMLIDDSEDQTCSTGLHIACLKLNVTLVKILLALKANPNCINNFKLMPMNLVEKESCEEALEIKNLLEKAGGQSKWNNYMD